MPFLYTLKDGKGIGKPPMLTSLPDAERLASGPPGVTEALTEWTICGRSLMNKDTLGFSDPTIEDCWDITKHYFRAAVWRKPESLRFVEKRRRCEFDPRRSPWAPRPAYVDLLHAQGRLPPDVSNTELNSTKSASFVDRAKAMLHDALGETQAGPKA